MKKRKHCVKNWRGEGESILVMKEEISRSIVVTIALNHEQTTVLYDIAYMEKI